MCGINRIVLRLVLFALAIPVIVTTVIILGSGHDSLFERRIIEATDQELSCAGECDIDLAMLFSDYEWDTASIFIAGNTKEVQAELHLDNDISDGIVFSKGGQQIIVEMSTYDFLHNESPKVSYYVERAESENRYYVTRPRDQALVHVKKYLTHENEYKYLLYFR